MYKLRYYYYWLDHEFFKEMYRRDLIC